MPDNPPEREAFTRIVFIAGPTASGKSAAALAIARHTGAEIVNADALQVYAGLPILTAQPSAAEQAGALHHLYAVADPTERWSAGHWAREAVAVLAGIASRGRAAIVVGGSGLYFRALGEGLSEIPAAPEAIRAAARAQLMADGPEAFRRRILASDAAMARLHPNDMQRHLRAFEVYLATGKPLSAFQAVRPTPPIGAIPLRVVIEPARDALYAACDARFNSMLDAGAMEEAAAFAARGLPSDLPACKALGLAELMACLDGRLTLDEAIVSARQATRRFAKRQMTWFRNQAADWRRVASPGDAIAFVCEGLR